MCACERESTRAARTPASSLPTHTSLSRTPTPRTVACNNLPADAVRGRRRKNVGAGAQAPHAMADDLHRLRAALQEPRSAPATTATARSAVATPLALAAALGLLAASFALHHQLRFGRTGVREGVDDDPLFQSF